MPNSRHNGRVSDLDRAYNERGLLRHGAARRALHCTPSFLGELVRRGKLREVTFTVGGVGYVGYDEARVIEIAARLDAAVPRAKV